MSLLAARRGTLQRKAASAGADPYGALVLSDAPVAWWRGNGSTADETGGTAGTLVGGTYGTSLLPARPTAQTYSLDGVDDHVNVPHQAKLSVASQITVEAWFNADTVNVASGAFNVVVCKSGGPVWSLDLDAGRPDFYLGGSIGVAARSGTALTAGTRNHIVGTYDGTNIRVHVNGTQVATAAASGAMPTGTGALLIGAIAVTAGGTVSDFFDGRIAEVAIYDRALTATEITEHYTAGTTA